MNWTGNSVSNFIQFIETINKIEKPDFLIVKAIHIFFQLR